MPEVTQHITTIETWIIELAEEERWVQTRPYSSVRFEVSTVLVVFEASKIDPSAPPKVTAEVRGKRKLKDGRLTELMAHRYRLPVSRFGTALPPELAAAITAAGLPVPA
jgi:hypothetical protein